MSEINIKNIPQDRLNEYWIHRGRKYKNEFNVMDETTRKRYGYQIDKLREVLQGVNPKNILELGCGFGRITQILSDVFPKSYIISLDISQEQINKVRALNLHNVDSICYDVMNYEVGGFDLVIASEFFMHLKPNSMKILAERLFHIPKIISIDLISITKEITNNYCFVHDFEKLFPNKTVVIHKLKLPLSLRFRNIPKQGLIVIE